MNCFDSDMSKSTNTVVYIYQKTAIYIYACAICRTQCMLPNLSRRFIHQHVHLRRESQSHVPAHVLMRLYPIDKSLVCLQSERRTSCQNNCLNMFNTNNEYVNRCVTDVRIVFTERRRGPVKLNPQYKSRVFSLYNKSNRPLFNWCDTAYNVHSGGLVFFTYTRYIRL